MSFATIAFEAIVICLDTAIANSLCSGYPSIKFDVSQVSMNPQFLEVDPSELFPNPWNANVVGPENQEKLDESIRRLPKFRPLVAREVPGLPGYQILGGKHRWESYLRQGITPVPVMNLGPISDQVAKEITLADNARYGVDDSYALADLLKSIGSAEDIATFLPHTEIDIATIFAVQDIALDELDLDGDDALPDNSLPETTAPAAKTHAMMRFKVPVQDAERITKTIKRVQKAQGFVDSDEATNAGDALVHLLLGSPLESDA